MFTIPFSDGTRNFSTQMLDPQNQPVGLQGYSQPEWTADDNGTLVSLNPLGDPVGWLQIIMKGLSGQFNLTATFKRAGSPDISVTEQVTLTGPAPDHAVMTLQPKA